MLVAFTPCIPKTSCYMMDDAKNSTRARNELELDQFEVILTRLDLVVLSWKFVRLEVHLELG